MSRLFASLSRSFSVQRRSASVLANAALLERSEVQSRVLSVLQSKSFVDSSKLNPSSSFFYDLGLDELHAAEIRQSLSAEFCVFVPETAAVNTVDAAVSFLACNPLAK